MSLNRGFFNRETNITAKVICDSVSPSGVRMTTFEIEFPRFVHCELMTHRSLSKNSSSSRAIPIKKMLDQIESNMAMPVYWGKAKSGMQATEEVEGSDLNVSKLEWKNAYYEVKDVVEWMLEVPKLHKQVPNRLTEPFQMMKVVISGTDWDNFFNLRIHKDSQPEICMLAYKMYIAMQNSSPNKLQEGEWHLPYVNIVSNDHETYYNAFEYDKGVGHTVEKVLNLEDAIKYSAACCASVSYRTEGMTLEKAEKIFDMLVKAEVVHASPFEHLAAPMKQFKEIENSDYETVGFVNCNTRPESWQKGITHVDKHGQLYSGNLRGYIQYRHLLKGNTCYKFNFEDRLQLFKE